MRAYVFRCSPNDGHSGEWQLCAPEAAILNRMEAMSAIVRTTDSSQTLRHVRGVPILLQKSVETGGEP
jgi:hypothetical protein